MSSTLVVGQVNSAEQQDKEVARLASVATSRAMQVPRKRASRPDLDLQPSAVSTSEPEEYLAAWDCVGDAANELTFEKGERLLVVDRQYEHHGWLVARKTGGHNKKVGLVPKNYVTKAT